MASDHAGDNEWT
jgi:hypothetical protein